MPLLILLTVVFAAVGVFVFVVIGLMVLIGMNGMSGPAATPWLWGMSLTFFAGYSALAGGLLSFISRRRRGPRWSFPLASAAVAVAFLVLLALFVAGWQLF